MEEGDYMEKNFPQVTGEEKRKIYANLKTRLKMALTMEFYFEAVMLEYAIIEDRTASILLHCEICKSPYDKKLTNKLNSIANQYGKQHPIISKKFDIKLIDRIMNWKDARNDAVHRACILPYTPEEMKTLADEGNEIVRLISNCARRISTATERAKAK